MDAINAFFPLDPTTVQSLPQALCWFPVEVKTSQRTAPHYVFSHRLSPPLYSPVSPIQSRIQGRPFCFGPYGLIACILSIDHATPATGPPCCCLRKSRAFIPRRILFKRQGIFPNHSALKSIPTPPTSLPLSHPLYMCSYHHHCLTLHPVFQLFILSLAPEGKLQGDRSFCLVCCHVPSTWHTVWHVTGT